MQKNNAMIDIIDDGKDVGVIMLLNKGAVEQLNI